MKFDDIDGPIEDLLYEDADFRFFDRQLKMAAQIWRADGLTPASAELELARGRGALMATLSARELIESSRKLRESLRKRMLIETTKEMLIYFGKVICIQLIMPFVK